MDGLTGNERTDKAESGYLRKYERHLAPLKEREIKLLELGIREGGSLLMWEEYFPHGTICGIDRDSIPSDVVSERIVMRKGDQSDTAFLSEVASAVAPDGFDIIIDDASHLGALSRVSFDHLFHNHLKDGGLYVVEDWGTGYWDAFPDGKRFKESRWAEGIFSLFPRLLRKQRVRSHDFGMVGFIKQLVDECALDDITKPGLGIPEFRSSSIDSLEICLGIVFIKKKCSLMRPVVLE